MSELDFEINPEVLENDSFERKPLQPGEYEGEIIGCETKTSAAGHKYLSVQVEVNGNWVWENLNLWHPKEDVVEIAKRKLTQIGVALGMSKITDTEQLLARRVKVDLRLQKNDSTRNEIVSWSAVAAPLTPPAEAASGTPPGKPAWQ